MTRLAEIESHRASMGELLEIVGAMRSLAGMRMQESLHALPGIRGYAESVAAAIGAALRLVPEPLAAPNAAPNAAPGRRCLVLCMAEHGFVGGFNERLLAAARAALGAGDLLFVLGARGAALAGESGQAIAWSGPMATRLAGVPDMVNRLADALYARIAQGEISRVEVLFGLHRQGSLPDIRRHALLPLDPAAMPREAGRSAPLHNLPPRVLLERLLAEYVFARLTEAAVESLASENAARFAAMAAAHDNVGRKLERLDAQARQARQEEITSELLDLLTGAAAMRGPLRRGDIRPDASIGPDGA